uniref:Reverse transcriptase domain-containing protein n=1 Tax=Tanacetum cinerariifolium TaxID=118510 RepID=A0A6L2N6A8_TANCI|nr:reverse transcriptase domain-containing protein [Tanacetum cinerariifolium]
MADNRTMEELLQVPTEGYEEAIVIPKINADHFEIKTYLLQLVQANPYHGFERENPHTHINSFKRITSTLKFKDVPNDVIKLMMVPYSLEGNARVWYDKEPPNSILTWDDLVNKFVNQFFHPSKTTHLKNKSLVSLKDSKRHLERHGNDLKKCLERAPTMDVRSGNLLSKTTREALQIIENKSKVRYSRNKSNVYRMNTTSRENASKSDDMIDKLADQISNLVDIFAKKVVTPALVKAVEESCVTRDGSHAYYNCLNTDSIQPSVCVATGTYNQVAPQNRASNYMAPPGFALVVEREIEETTDKEQTNFQGSTAHIQPPVTPILEPDVPMTLPKPNIPYPLRLNDQKLREKATNQMEKFFQIFLDLHFDISFADALLLMPKFASTVKSLLTNKDKLFELAKISLNENCSAMLLKKLLEKLGDPGKFLIPCDFPRMDRSFLRIGRALIDVYGKEITLWVNDEVVTFNLNQTMRYSSTYDDLSVNRIDIIDVAREEYAQEVFEEIEAYLTDESILSEIDHDDCDREGDICLIEKLLNDDPFQLPSMGLKQGEVVKEKSSIEEPSELELKDLPSHLKYAYLEGVDKLPVIIVKDLKVDEKEAIS